MPRRLLTRFLALMMAAFLLLPGMSAQQVSPAPKSRASAPVTTARARLTAEQEHGLRLLKTAEAQSAGLQPDMRAFVLWQAARAYTILDPAKASALMRQAFQVTLSVENPPDDPNCNNVDFCVKGWLQNSILSDILKKDLKGAEELLPTAEASVRASITAKLERR